MPALALLRLRHGLPNRASYFAFFIVALGLSLMVLQLVPLPPSIWANMVGREFVVKDFSLLELQDSWLPLSLSPAMTRQDIISLLPALAAFFAIISISPRDWPALGWAIVGFALVSALVGLAQRFFGQNSGFNFFNYGDPLTASGFFANRNFLAAQIYAALPFLAVLTLQGRTASTLQRRILPIIALLIATILIAALGATGSRMGAILLVVTLLLMVFLVYSGPRTSTFGKARVSALGMVGLIIGSIVVAQLLLAALLRFSESDIASDYRGTVFDISMVTMKAFFPVGSGFGSFVPAYMLFEKPSILVEAYVNHAHNDWLELLIEGGLPMAMVLLAFIIWFGVMFVSAWRKPMNSLYSKAASISIAMLLLHSCVDYPLRTPAMMAMFGLFCGMLAVNRAEDLAKTPKMQNRQASLIDDLPVDFKPSSRGFSNRSET